MISYYERFLKDILRKIETREKLKVCLNSVLMPSRRLDVSSLVFQERTKERLGRHAVGGVPVVPTRIEDVPFR